MSNIPHTTNCWRVSKRVGEMALPGMGLLVSMASRWLRKLSSGLLVGRCCDTVQAQCPRLEGWSIWPTSMFLHMLMLQWPPATLPSGVHISSAALPAFLEIWWTLGDDLLLVTSVGVRPHAWKAGENFLEGQKNPISLRNHIVDSGRVGKLKLLLQNPFVVAVKQAADNPSPRCHRQHYKGDLYRGIKCFSAVLLEYQAQTDCSIHRVDAFEYILVLNKWLVVVSVARGSELLKNKKLLYSIFY